MSKSGNTKDRIFSGALRLNGVHQAHLVLRTVRQFCQSASPELVREHIPRYGRLLGASDNVLAEVRAWALNESKTLWARMVDKHDDIPLGHDG